MLGFRASILSKVNVIVSTASTNLFIDGILYAFQEETNDAAKEWEEGEPDLRRISDKLETEKASLNAMGGRRIEISDSFMTDKGVVMHRNSTASLLAAWSYYVWWHDQGNLKSRGSIEDFVSFREMITSQLQGKLTLFVLSSSNRGRLLGFLI
ncbi:hypothetical protein Tco_0199490 [Tanacetum coccineum]